MKAVVICDGPEAQLRSQLAELDLPRRALSYPIDLIPAPSLPSFVELWGEIDRLRDCIERWPGPLRAWLVKEFLPVSCATAAGPRAKRVRESVWSAPFIAVRI